MSPRSVVRSIAQSLVKRDRWWARLPRRWQESTYLRVQRQAALETEFARQCDRLFANRTVREGPFRGLVYPRAEALGSAWWPKIVGSYEAELHIALERLIQRRPGVVIDVGFAEGYYLAGLGRRLPDATLVGFDIDPAAHPACRALAQANAIDLSRLSLHSAFSPEALDRFLPASGLVICDCEGYEEQVFSDELLPLWHQCALVIECHDFIRPGITATLAKRLRATHTVEVLTSFGNDRKRAAVETPDYAMIRAAFKERLVDEGRPDLMKWIVAEPNDAAN